MADSDGVSGGDGDIDGLVDEEALVDAERAPPSAAIVSSHPSIRRATKPVVVSHRQSPTTPALTTLNAAGQ